MLRRGGQIKSLIKPLQRGRLAKRGQRADDWQKFRDAKFKRDQDEEGLIRCQDWKIGLDRCGVARSSMDLHHIEGREGSLLLEENKTVWLTRECHEAAHSR